MLILELKSEGSGSKIKTGNKGLLESRELLVNQVVLAPECVSRVVLCVPSSLEKGSDTFLAASLTKVGLSWRDRLLY